MGTVIGALVHTYISGGITLREFQDWFIPLTWDVQRFNREMVEIIRGIQLALAEFSSGDRTEEELRKELAAIALKPEVHFRQRPVRMTSATITVDVFEFERSV